jgi:hypothetical protein
MVIIQKFLRFKNFAKSNNALQFNLYDYMYWDLLEGFRIESSNEQIFRTNSFGLNSEFQLRTINYELKIMPVL